MCIKFLVQDFSKDQKLSSEEKEVVNMMINHIQLIENTKIFEAEVLQKIYDMYSKKNPSLNDFSWKKIIQLDLDKSINKNENQRS